MPRKYRLLLQTTQRLYMVGGADQVTQLPAILSNWFLGTVAGRGVYDDQIQTVMMYEYDPMTNSYQRRNSAGVGSKQSAINAIYGFVGV